MKNKLKSPYFLFVLLFTIQFYSLTAQQWDWVKSIANSGELEARSLTTDKEGNTLVTGSFKGLIDLNGIKLSSYGGKDLFVAKYNNLGELLWIRQGGSNADEESFNVICGNENEVFITGYFSGYMNLDNLALGNGVGQEFNNSFIIKYDKNGVIQWAIRSTGTGNNSGNALALDKEGNIFVTGVFEKSMSFQYEDHSKKHKEGEEEDEPTIIESNSESNVYVAKIAANSTFLWLVQSDGDGLNEPTAIETDISGNCYISGNFSEDFDFMGTKLLSKGAKDIFVVKYNSNGKLVYANSIGGDKKDECSAMLKDANGNLYLTGTFSGTINLGKNKLKAKSDETVFILKMNADGNIIWAKQMNELNKAKSTAITRDSGNNLYLMGNFNRPFHFAGSSFSSAGDQEVFILKYKENGDPLKGAVCGGKGNDEGLAITVNEKSECIIMTSINEEANFNAISVKGNTETFNVLAKMK